MRLTCIRAGHPPLVPAEQAYSENLKVPQWRCPKCRSLIGSEIAIDISGIYWASTAEDTYETIVSRVLKDKGK